MVADIRSTCAKNTSIGSTCAVGTLIGCIGIGDACTGDICAKTTSVGSVEPRVLAGLGVILANLWVNN